MSYSGRGITKALRTQQSETVVFLIHSRYIGSIVIRSRQPSQSSLSCSRKHPRVANVESCLRELRAIYLCLNRSLSCYLLSQLKVSRARVLELISSSSTTVEDITTVSTEYLSLLRGLVDNPTAGGDSKLRHVTAFKWTNSLGGRVPR